MSGQRLPPVAPVVLADAVEALPARLRKRLDETVAQAAGWPSTVDGAGIVTVTVDEQTVVTLIRPVRAAGDAVCSCLLAPRCLHRTAVLAAAPVLTELDEAPPVALTPAPSAVPVPTTPAQREAAERLWQAAIPVLDTGIPGAGNLVQAQLLRAVHDARAAGLHRAGAAAVRVVESLRAARADDPRFRLGDLTDDLCELLTVCHQLTGDHGDVALARGTARRAYDDAGGLKVWGLFVEPVLTTSGYAGASTYLSDQDGQLWTVNDVRPGGLGEARSAADIAITLGDARLTHREAARAGLVIVGARASASGRLSVSGRTQAVRSAGRSWTEPPLSGLWTSPADQLARYDEALGLPAPVRPAGYDLLFLQGRLNTGHSGLSLDADGIGPVAVVADLTDPALPVVGNLRLLARAAVGQEARLIGRIAGTRTVHGLALAAAWLPEQLGGHVDLATDRLQRSELPGSVDAGPVEVAPLTDVPNQIGSPVALQLLRHRTERAVSGGRAAIRTRSAADAVRLTAAHLPSGAALLTALHDAAEQRTRDVFGRIDPLDTGRLARCWLAVATYTGAAQRYLDTAGWLSPPPAAS